MRNMRPPEYSPIGQIRALLLHLTVFLLYLQVQGHVDDAVAKGATITVGGSKPDLPEPYNKVSLP